MFTEDYQIKLNAFEGPLELLLELIEKRKLHINDISLSGVTDDFINFLKDKENFPLGVSANFILVASTLLLIKSKSLLPTIDLTPDEEASMEDLEKRLKELERIKHLSKYIKELFGKQIIFAKIPGKDETIVFAPDVAINPLNIHEAVLTVLESLPKKEIKPEIKVRKVVSLEEIILKLSERITKALRMSFKEFSGHSSGNGKKIVSHDEKVGIIVGFLAVLELAKQGTITVAQEGLFQEINMETENVSIPTYN